MKKPVSTIARAAPTIVGLPITAETTFTPVTTSSTPGICGAEMSNSLAHTLRAMGLRQNDIVPIIAVRSWHIIVAILGILKAGGAYMPVDPTYPKDRIEYMINAAKCGITVTYGYLETLDIKTILLDSFDFSYNPTPVENINSLEDLCYVIFTSGSTGNPKGVSISHQNVLNYCHNNNNNNNVCHAIIRANYRSIVSVTNIVFDIFVTESILPLLNGITIYFANDEQVFFQKQLSKLISANNIDVIQTTPTKMRSYIMDKQNVTYLKKLKAIILGGEALPANQYFWDDVEVAVSATIVTFDAFMIESILTLACGRKIIFASENDIYSQTNFEKLFNYSSKNLFFSTPTKLKNYVDRAC